MCDHFLSSSLLLRTKQMILHFRVKFTSVVTNRLVLVQSPVHLNSFQRFKRMKMFKRENKLFFLPYHLAVHSRTVIFQDLSFDNGFGSGLIFGCQFFFQHHVTLFVRTLQSGVGCLTSFYFVVIEMKMCYQCP